VIDKVRETTAFMLHIVSLLLYMYSERFKIVEKPFAKRLRGRSRQSWKDNIKMELKNFDVGSIDWIVLSQDLVCNQ
jgi:hypothetical protein